MKRYLIIVFVIISCHVDRKKDKEVANDYSKEKALEIIVINKESSVFNKQIIVNGKVNASRKTKLSFRSNNRLNLIKVVNGQKVSNGELLAFQNNEIIKNNLEKAEIELKKAQNRLLEEKIKYDQKNLSQIIVENLEIKSGVLEAKNQLERAKIEHNQSILTAPHFGIVANIEKKEGEFINNSEVFCTVINPNILEINFSLLENEFNYINKGQTVEFQSYNQKDISYKAIVSQINPVVDKNGLIKIKAKVISQNTALLDGMHVKLCVNKSFKDVIIIPKKALVLRSNKEVVFTIENGLVKWNSVEIYDENKNSFAIKSNLNFRDTVIVSDNLNLSHGTKVKSTFMKELPSKTENK